MTALASLEPSAEPRAEGAFETPRSRAASDAVYIALLAVVAWAVISRTRTGDRFFEWVQQHPQLGMDSILLAAILTVLGIFAFAVRRYREMRSEVRERQIAEERAHSLAYHDPVTGLPNRRALSESIESIVGVRRQGFEAALLILDLDRFKAVNDVHGHQAGDELLLAVAKRLSSLLPPGGRAFRLGGDEFAILVDRSGVELGASRRTACRVTKALSEPFQAGGRAHHIGASVGIALFPEDAEDREGLMRKADIALYRAKASGRNQHRSFEPAMDAEISRRSKIEAELRQGLQRGEFVPFYQPLIDLRTGATVGFELLARWQRPDAVVIGPAEFIPIAEDSGLINRLMLQLIGQACRDARTWDPGLTIAINVSPVQLNDSRFGQKVLAVLARAGFAPERLAVEITENALIGDAENAALTIGLLKSKGVEIGLDDFGTGYSSLHHLRMLPLDKLKIDRSFVQAIGQDSEALKIVSAIVSLARSLDIPVIAEGIESAEIAAQLRELGCAQGQGFHLGMPISGETVTRILSRPVPFRWETATIRRRRSEPTGAAPLDRRALRSA